MERRECCRLVERGGVVGADGTGGAEGKGREWLVLVEGEGVLGLGSTSLLPRRWGWV